jgi:hypothetical protein
MNCRWREKAALCVDDEPDRGVQQEFPAHLSSYHECAAAVSAQMELKKAVRIAGRTHTALEQHVAVYRSIHLQLNFYLWSKWMLVPFSELVLSTILFLSFSRSHRDPIMTALADQAHHRSASRLALR